MLRGMTFYGIALILIVVAVSCGSQKNDADKNDPALESSGQPASQVAFRFAAYDVNGTLRHSSEWIGQQPVVINIWGTWCPPCRREIPDLVKLYDEYRYKGIEIIGLALERDRSARKVEEFAQANNMQWVMLIADRSVAQAVRLGSGVPTTIFLNQQGKEVTRFVGPRSYDVFKEAFESILE